MISMWVVIWLNKDTRPNRRKMHPLPWGSSTSPTRRNESWLTQLIVLSLLYSTVIRMMSLFFEMMDIGLAYGEVEQVLDGTERGALFVLSTRLLHDG